jgi:streptogramin lyase
MTAFQFESTLRMALREAAEREEQSGRLARSAAKTRSTLLVTGRWLPVTAVVGAILLALAVAAVVLTFGHSERTPVRPPKVVARLMLADSLGGAVSANGSLWIEDRGRNRLLRIDPHTRQVTARLPVPDDVAMAPAGGALWTLPVRATHRPNDFQASLLRIDPRTGRLAARVPLRTPHGEPFAGLALAADQDAVWILGTTPTWHDRDKLGALRVDPRSGRVTTLIALPGRWGPDGIAVRGGDLWAITTNSRLLRFDARTGRKLSDSPLSLQPPDPNADPVPGSLGFAGDALVTTVRGGLARIDPYTGRVVWRRPLGQNVQTWTGDGGLIWAAVATRKSDRLFAVDPHDGHVATSVDLVAFGSSGIAAIDHQLWVTTAAGEAVVLAR